MQLVDSVEVTTIPEALLNTLLGMGTVFAVLILISFIIGLLKYVPQLLAGGGSQKKEEVKNVPTAVPAKDKPVPPVAKTVASATDDGQLAAVIAAAIAAQMTEETGVSVAADGLVIRSIKKRTFSN